MDNSTRPTPTPWWWATPAPPDGGHPYASLGADGHPVQRSDPAPGQYTFTLPNLASDVIESVSLLRTGGSFRSRAIRRWSPTSTRRNRRPPTRFRASGLRPPWASAIRPQLPRRAWGYPILQRGGHHQHPGHHHRPQPDGRGTGGRPRRRQSTTVTMKCYDTLQVVNASGLSLPQRDVMGAQVDATETAAARRSRMRQVPAGYTFWGPGGTSHPRAQLGHDLTGPTRAAKRHGTHYWRVMAMRQHHHRLPSRRSRLPGDPERGAVLMSSTRSRASSSRVRALQRHPVHHWSNVFGAGTGDPAMAPRCRWSSS